MVVFLVLLQLLASGVLGPRLRCYDADGTVCAELAAFRCCDRSSSSDCGADSDCDGCVSSPQPTDGQTIAQSSSCGCTDVPDLTDPATIGRAASSSEAVVPAPPIALVLPASFDLYLLVSGPPLSAYLPHGHSPPRLHLATIVLRI